MNRYDSIRKVLIEFYGIEGEIDELVAYQDRNFAICTESRDRFVFKITMNPTERSFIDSQNRVLLSLSDTLNSIRIPCPIANQNGDYITAIDWEGVHTYGRLFPWIEGTFLADSQPDMKFYHELGTYFGKLNQELIGLEDPVLINRSHDWDLARISELAEDIQLIPFPEERRLVAYFMMKWREEVQPIYHKLPKQLIHGDGNDYNVLLNPSSRFYGLIDFGDMVFSARIHEIAIVLAYCMMNRDDYVMVYENLIKGYHSVTPLTDLEEQVLSYLIPARWCQTMIHAARKLKENPGSEYHQVSVSGASSMLKKWIRIPTPTSLSSKGGAELLRNRQTYFTSNLSLSYDSPIHMVGAAFQYMYGADGKTYLDCVNNIPHVGHCHPKVVEAGQRQMAKLNTNTRYLYESLDKYAEKLLSKFPFSLKKVFFVNSGSAATDLAVRLAEAHTGRKKMMVLNHAYHGNTRSAIELSPYKFNRKGGGGPSENITIVDLPPRGGGINVSPLDRGMNVSPLDRDANVSPLAPLKQGGYAAFFAESIPGCAGQILLSKEFMKSHVDWIREQGGIYVADEVQTGFGRVGETFWGFELYDVVPDIVIVGKPIANGHPMGAVICTEEVAESFENGMEFFSSFGGNPVSCEIGLAVLKVIEEEGLQEHAKKVGNLLMDHLQLLKVDLKKNDQSNASVKEIRGSGLFLGIEMVKGPDFKEPDSQRAKWIVNEMKDQGILLSTDGPDENVIKFKPPMCFSEENAMELVENLREVLFKK